MKEKLEKLEMVAIYKLKLNCFKFILVFSLLNTIVLSQEKIELYSDEKNKESNLDNKNEEIKSSSSQEKKNKQEKEFEKKKYSIMPSLGFGKVDLQISDEKYEPYTSPSEFTILGLLGAGLTSQNSANNVSGGLSTQSLASLIAVDYFLRKNIYAAKGNSVYNRFYLDIRDHKEDIGVQMGLTSGFYAITFEQSKTIQSFVPSLFTNFSSPILNQYGVFSFFRNTQPFYTNITTFDINFTKHFMPDEKFDIYLSSGIGIGGCLVECRAVKGSARLGLRWNFSEEFYSFVESEIQILLLFATDRKYSPIIERNFLFGVGHYL